MEYKITYREHPDMWVMEHKTIRGSLQDALAEGARLLEELRGKGRKKAVVYVDGLELTEMIALGE